jgi:hypothetical protein
MTPFKTTQQLDTDRRFKEEKQNMMDNQKKIRDQMMGNQEPLLEFKLNQPQVQQQQPQMPNQIYPSPYVPVPNPYYPLATNMMMPWQYTPNNVPIIKKYNISLGNGNGDITKLANLYEDMIPNEMNISNNTFNTINERLTLHHYMRSIFVRSGDGEEILMNGGSKTDNSELTNLLSHIKLLEINPYHYRKGNNDNPYLSLPENFVMYRSCYPVRLNQYNAVECSKSNIGINIKIFLLSQFDDAMKNEDNRYKSDIWRELDYYHIIRENIIKKNISPNFVILHSYYISKNTGIDFGKFLKIKNKFEPNNYRVNKNNINMRNELYKQFIIDKLLPITEVSLSQLITAKIIEPNITDITDEHKKKYIDYKFKQKSEYNKRFFDSEFCLVMISEAPTHNILNWGTKTYKLDSGPVKTMIQSGYHSENVWKSIIAQLLFSVLIMYKEKFIFTEFSFENNIYIKDLNTNDQNIGLWKYIYNGIDYYVQNYGYLLLIDSNFKELQNPFNSPLETITDFKYRILSMKFNDNFEVFNKKYLEQMISIFDSNFFGGDFKKFGGIPPTDKINKLLTKIKTAFSTIQDKYSTRTATEQKLSIFDIIHELILKILYEDFELLNNRIGTILMDQEKIYIGDSINPNTQIGKIVLHTTGIINTFVIFNGKTEDDASLCYILTKESQQNPNYIQKKVSLNDLRDYNNEVEQIFKGKTTNILDTYLISIYKSPSQITEEEEKNYPAS